MTLLAPERGYGRPAQPIVWLTWPEYLQWISGRLVYKQTSWGERIKLGPPWEPGEHWALDGPTGEGKTTHAVGMLGARKYVMALDPKGEDETLSQSGYVRVGSMWEDKLKYQLTHRADAKTWQDLFKRIDAGLDARVIVGHGSDNVAQDAHNRSLMAQAIMDARFNGGWTLYVDEFELLSSQRMFNQGPSIERMLITARRKHSSVVTSFQAPAWISSHATRQARRATKWPTGDADMVVKLARAMGRDWRQVAEAVDELPPFHTITMPRGKFHPIVIASAPELGSSGSSGSQLAGQPANRSRLAPGGPGDLHN